MKYATPFSVALVLLASTLVVRVYAEPAGSPAQPPVQARSGGAEVRISEKEVDLLESWGDLILDAADKAGSGDLTPEEVRRSIELTERLLDRIRQRFGSILGGKPYFDDLEQRSLLDRVEQIEDVAETANLLFGVSGTAEGSGETGSESDSYLRSGLSPDCTYERLKKTHLEICYNPDWKVPFWVGYRLDADQLKGKANRRGDFRIDPDLDAGLQATGEDYQGSGFDFGHMAAPSDFRADRLSNSETFLMTNIAPQTPALNRAAWRRIEQEIRHIVTPATDVWVYTGNIVSVQEADLSVRRIGEAGDVHVPAYCWKAVLVTKKNSAEVLGVYGFLVANVFGGLPNRSAAFAVSVDHLEELTGLDFFGAIEDGAEEELEARVSGWPPLPRVGSVN